MPNYSKKDLKKLADSVANSTPNTSVRNRDSIAYRKAQESVVKARRNAAARVSLRPIR
jgi:hypothetical protein